MGLSTMLRSLNRAMGFVYTRSPFKYLEDLVQYKKEARENNEGKRKQLRRSL
jgi:hypothetical protein